jgi:hypothetical protein
MPLARKDIAVRGTQSHADTANSRSDHECNRPRRLCSARRTHMRCPV